MIMENELNKKKPLNEGDLEKVTGGGIPMIENALFVCSKCEEKFPDANQLNIHEKTCKGKSE